MGSPISFWDDLWGSEILSHKFPELFSYARKKKITFAEGVSHTPLHSLFHLPLSQQAHMQMIQLQVILDGFPVNDASDIWSYIWNSNIYSVKRIYKHLSGQLTPHPTFRWLQACPCQSKHKVFFWLLLKDRLSTRELLKRKNMALQDYSCVLCNANIEESLTHLFLECPFAIQCWLSSAFRLIIAQTLLRICRASKISCKFLSSWK